MNPKLYIGIFMAWLCVTLALIVISSCATTTVHIAVNSEGAKPGDSQSVESSVDSQMMSDMESKINGIDNSQQEIQDDADDLRRRNEAVDRVNPDLPRHQRKELYDQ